MKITDKEMQEALHAGKFVRRAAWQEKRFCYHLGYDGSFECGYRENEVFEPCNDDADRFGFEYDEIFEDDWGIMEEAG